MIENIINKLVNASLVWFSRCGYIIFSYFIFTHAKKIVFYHCIVVAEKIMRHYGSLTRRASVKSIQVRED